MTSVFCSDAIKHCLFENHFLTLHTPNRKKHEWELRNAESDSNASDTVAPDADNFTSTSITSASKPRESADATSNNGINASNSLGLKETESMRLVAKARSSFQSAQSSSQALSGFPRPSHVQTEAETPPSNKFNATPKALDAEIVPTPGHATADTHAGQLSKSNAVAIPVLSAEQQNIWDKAKQALEERE